MKLEIRLPFAAAVLILAGGCASPGPDAAAAKIVAQLEEANRSVEALNRLLTPPSRSAELRKQLEEAAAGDEQWKPLLEIELLGSRPSEDEIRAYIRAIRKATEKRRSFGGDDPPVWMYRAIGGGHAKAVAQEAPGDAYYFWGMTELVGPDDADAVLEVLREHPPAARLLARLSLTEEKLKEAMLDLWRNSRKELSETRQFAVRFGTSQEELRQLEEAAVANPCAYFLFDTLKFYDGVDVDALRKRAWAAQRGEPSALRVPLARELASQGDVEALELLAGEYVSRPDMRRKMNYLLTLFSPAFSPGEAEEFIRAWEAGKGSVKFDPAVRKFRLGGSER